MVSFFICVVALTNPLFSQSIIISEVMSNPNGAWNDIPGDDSNEFIELYNFGPDSIDLEGWSIDDGDDIDFLTNCQAILPVLPSDSDGIYNSTIISPFGFALIIDPEYVSQANDQPYNWPAGCVVLTISSTTDLGGSRLSDDDPITIFDSYGDTIDYFPAEFDPEEGSSIERNLPNSAGNWMQCNAGSTPGYRNSNWPFPRDLRIDSLISSSNPITSSPGSLFVFISNSGDDDFTDGILYIFLSEELTEPIDSFSISFVEAGGQRVIEFPLDLPNGHWTIIAQLGEDDNSSNNSGAIDLLFGPDGWPICITEFMFMPLTGYSEWIEIYNRGEESIDLTGWQIGDELTLKNIPACTLDAGQFAVLCRDTSTFFDTLCEGSILLEPSSWASLNNDEDQIRLFDNNGLPRQSIQYNSNNFGECMTNGISAEVTSIGGTSLVCSPSGNSVGCDNAIWSKPEGDKIIEIEPNPFDPSLENVLIKLSLPAGGLEVKIYDRLGNIKKVLSSPDNPIGYEISWNGTDDRGDVLPSGIYIVFAKDSDGNRVKKAIAITGGVK